MGAAEMCRKVLVLRISVFHLVAGRGGGLLDAFPTACGTFECIGPGGWPVLGCPRPGGEVVGLNYN